MTTENSIMTRCPPTLLETASTWISVFMVFAVFGRIMEVFTPLAILKPALLTIFLGFVLGFLSGRLTFRDFYGTPEGFLLLLYCLVGAAASLFAYWPGGAFRVWFDMMLFNFFFFLVFNVNIEGEYQFGLAGAALIGSAVILGLGTLYINPHVVIESGGVERVSVGVTYDSNDLGLIMVTCLPLALAYFLNGNARTRILSGISIAVILLTSLKTGSRGTLVGLVAIGSGFLLMRTVQISYLKKSLVTAAAVAAVILFAPEDLWIRMNNLFEGEDYNFQTRGEVESLPGRILIWTSGLKLITPKVFFFGVGPGQFATALGARFGRFFYITAHNTFLQVLVELGIFGLLLFLAMHVVILRNCSRAEKLFRSGPCDSALQDLPRYTRISLLGLTVCVMFLSRAYSRIYPILLVYSSALAWVAEERLAKTGNEEVTDPDGRTQTTG